jgi:hypothetical protein
MERCFIKHRDNFTFININTSERDEDVSATAETGLRKALGSNSGSTHVHCSRMGYGFAVRNSERQSVALVLILIMSNK